MYDPNKPSTPEQEATTRFTQRIENEPSLIFLEKLHEQFPNLELCLVGGMVRDIYLNHPTPKDYDFIARGVDAEDLVNFLKTLGSCELKGRNFGVIKFRPDDCKMEKDEFIDIALPRQDQSDGTGGYRDFNAQVDPNLPIETDLARRDLTINALAWNLKDKKIIDPFDGLTDLKNGTIKTVGEPQERFQEDYSRLLRAIRFACKFNFEIEPKTWQAMQDLMPHINDEREIPKISSLERQLALASTDERKEKILAQIKKQQQTDPEAVVIERVIPIETITQELLKTLQANPARALELLDQSGALEQLMPELLEMKGCRQPEKYHSEGDVWEHTKLMLEKISSHEFQEQFPNTEITGEFVLAVLLHDVGKPRAQEFDNSVEPPDIHFHGHAEEGVAIANEIANRLKLSTKSKKGLTFLVQNHMFAITSPDIRQISTHKFSKRFLDNPYSGDLLKLFFLDSLCSIRPDGSAPMDNFYDTDERITEIKEVRSAQPEKIIDGNLIKSLLEVEGGPFIRVINLVLSELADNGVINNEKQAASFLQNHKKFLTSFVLKVTPSNTEQIANQILKDLPYEE